MTRRTITPDNTHAARIEDGNPARLRSRVEAWISNARTSGALVQTIRPIYESRRLIGYDLGYIAPAPIPTDDAPPADAAPPAMPAMLEPVTMPAPAIVATPLGLAYLLPGIEPAPVRLSEHVAQAAMF